MSNSAAFLVSAKARPLEVREAPMPTPAANEVLIKVAAVAVNPVDWKLQEYAIWPLNYPNIQGSDVSGTVTAVGSAVTHFAEGDRVLAHTVGLTTGNNANGGFQQYATTTEVLVAKIPASLSFEQAVVVPLGLSTASAALYQDEYLALERPVANGRGKGQGAILIWGASSSVGSNAVQLAVASGYEVVATASPKNFDFVKKLGASQVLDYNSSSIVEDLVAALKGKTLAGTFDSISENGTTEKLAQVVVQANATKRFVAGVLPIQGLFADGKVEANQVFATTIMGNTVGPDVYRNFVEPALANGSFIAAPPALVVPTKGLEGVQEGYDLQKKGVSAQKVVIVL